MSPLEVIATLISILGVTSIPLAAIITRKNSPIGQALADRIRARKGRTIAPPEVRDPSSTDSDVHERMVALIESQQQSLDEMAARVRFLERLVEKNDE